MTRVSGYAWVKSMQSSIVNKSQRNLARGAAVLIIAGLAAGCSSGVARFNGVDDIFTSSTNQRQIIPPASQPYPGDQPAQVAAAPVAQPGVASNGPIGRTALAPVAGSQPVSTSPAAVSAQAIPQPAPALNPVATAAAAQSVNEDIKGWSRDGGSQITAKEGETVYNLSRRFGVPADVIMKANGLNSSTGLQAGQKIIIPSYLNSDKAGSSAPTNAAMAKPSQDTKYDVPGNKVPVPSKAPANKVAVSPQTPKDTQSAVVGGTYKVQEGDTLTRIAKKTGVGVAALKQANGMQTEMVRIGQTLKVPSGNAASTQVASAPAKVDKVKTSSTNPSAKVEPVVSYTPPKKADKVIEEAEQDTAAAPNATGINRMRWPVRGRVISNYGAGGGKNGDGIDIAVPEGTSVKAAENGVVIYAGDGLKEFGNTVLVRHENGLVTVYGHASELKVARGEKVKRGQEIARSGMSGTTDMPKLHFEVRKNSSPVDPSTFLE